MGSAIGCLASSILYLEERSYDDSTASHAAIVRPLVKLLLLRSLADRMKHITVFRAVGWSPLYAFLGILIVYLVFVLLYFPFYGIGLVISPLGSFFSFLLGVLLLARWFARCLTFPAHTPAYQRQVSQEYIKAFTKQLAMCHGTCTEVYYVVLTTLNNVPAETGQKRIRFRLKDMTSITTNVAPFMLANLEQLIEESAEAGPVHTPRFSVPELTALEELKDALVVLLAQVQLINAGPVGVALRPLLGKQDTSFPQLNQCLRGLVGDQTAVVAVTAAYDASQKLKQALTKISTPLEQLIGGGGERVSPLTTVKQTIASAYTYPVGFERASFPLMRLTLGAQYATTRFAAFGPNGNKIDCIFFSSGGRPNTPGLGSGSGVADEAGLGCGSGGGRRDQFVDAVSAAASPHVRLPLKENGIGIVLYCNPNAAVYETLCMMPRNASYVGMYLDMGYDVVCYNYRGYVCSEGTPTPNGLNSDGLAVAKVITRCIRGEVSDSSARSSNGSTGSSSGSGDGFHGERKFIVHGQSLGGMVACHIAAHTPPDTVSVLVCDRTFASLDSVAGRMLGNWAGLGLRALACWKNDSVSAFLTAKCPKIVLQDPNDEIIYHSASLKCGIATYLALKENMWNTRKFDHKFLIAAYSGHPLPFGDVTTAAGALLIADTDGEGSMFSMDSTISINSTSTPTDSPEDAVAVASIAMSAISVVQKQVLSAAACIAPKPAGPLGDRAPILTECFVQHVAACLLEIYSKSSLRQETKPEAGQKKSDGSSNISGGGGEDQAASTNPTSSPVQDPQVKEVADVVWRILLKIGSDGCGQLLGQAVAKGFDEIRSWMCCYVVWSHISLHDTQLPSGLISVEDGVSEVKTCMNRLQNKYDLGTNKYKSAEISPGRQTLQSPSGLLAEFFKVLTFLVEGMDILVSLNVEHSDILSEKDANNEKVHSKDSGKNKSDIKYARSISHPTCGGNTLLPLHCGHNGLPTSVELSMLQSLIKQKASLSRGSY